MRVQSVDYMQLASAAKTIASEASDINIAIKKAFNLVQDLHISWTGRRYNNFVEQFNKLTTDMNSLLKLTVTDIPYILTSAANIYAEAMEGRAVTTVLSNKPNNVTKLPVYNDKNIKFLEEAARDKSVAIKNQFTEIKTSMATIQSTLKAINWDSQASREFMLTFNKLKTSIDSYLTETSNAYSKLMNSAITDMQTIENINKKLSSSI